MPYLTPVFQLVGVFLLLACASADAQDSLRVPSQILLKRLAEAVDGNRHGGVIYIVARYDSLSPIAGVFRERREAEALARRLGSSHDVFGPYRRHPDLSARYPTDEMILFGCKHNRWTSEYTPICPERVFPLQSVQEISLTIRMRDGTTRTMDLGLMTDAVFLSQAAIDKFVIPYYEGIVGVDAAAAMRRDITERTTATSREPPP